MLKNLYNQDSGADFVKLQTYTPDTMTIKSNKKNFKIKMDCGRGKIYGRFIIKHKHHLNGKNHCLNTLKSWN